MSALENRRLWSALLTLTSALNDLASIANTASKDMESVGLCHLITLKVDRIIALFEGREADADDLHGRVTALEQHRADREADSRRPVHVKIVRDKEKQNEKV